MDIGLDSLYHKITESALVAIGVTDMKGNFILVNKTWCELLGYTMEESKSLTINNITSPEDVSISDDTYNMLLKGQLPSFQKTRKYIRKNGSAFWANLNVSPIKDNSDTIIGVLGIFIDIDKQVSGEHHLKEANHVLQELNKELMKANHAINQKNEELRIAHKKLDELARTDVLTSLANRRELENLLDTEVRRANRNKHPFTVGIGDIDNFKHVNDTYGHDAGDAILKSIANIFKSQVRNTDMVGRWGGEEFLFILPETECQAAKIVLERIRYTIETNYVEVKDVTLNVTITIGFSSFKPGSSITHIIKEADLSLYEGKHRGKNTSLCYEDIETSPQTEINLSK